VNLGCASIYPRAREIVVETPDGLARTYGDSLEWFEAMPAFGCAVAELFARPPSVRRRV